MSSPIALFIPCLVDQVIPEVGESMYRLLRYLGYDVVYTPDQTCCGQPAFNSGQRRQALHVACHCLDAFPGNTPIVCPSGSCTSMVRHHYAKLFAGHPRLADANALGARVREFSEFLVAEGCVPRLRGRWEGRVGIHTSCHSYRELRLAHQPIDLLRGIEGAEFVVPDGEPVCCGFGGTFSVKFTPISRAMARSRLVVYFEEGATTLVVNDPGCIHHLRQTAANDGLDLDIIHLAQFLDRAMLEPAEQP